MGRLATTARRTAACLIVSLAGLALSAHGAAAAVHVYVSNQGSNSVSVYSIAASGALSPVTCDPSTNCATGTHPFGVVIDSSGRHLYTGNNQSNSISVFSIGADGALSPVTCDPTTSCKTPGGSGPIAIDPLGRYLYGTNNFGDHGSVSVWSIGADGALTPVSCDQTTNCATNGGNPNSIAVDPSGTHVYVGNQLTNSVSVYAIGPDGALSPVTCDPSTSCKTGDVPSWITISPSGKFAYVANDVSSGSVSVFSIAADGALSSVSCDPTTSCTATSPGALAIDATRGHLFALNNTPFSGSVSSFDIRPDGTLSPIACSPATNCATGHFPEALAVDPIGEHLYVPNFVDNFVNAFGVGAGGEISPVACDQTTSCKTGSDPSNGSIVASPDQGPAAAFSTTASAAGSPSSFDASASSSPDYPIASYAWNFGDGQTQTSSTPTTQHTYGAPGTYNATLTVTDEAGCSTALVFTGLTASCNGSPKATVAQALTVTKALPPTVSKLKLSPSAFFAAPSGPSVRAAKKKRKRRTYGAIVSYVDTVAAKTTFTVQRTAAGRRKGHACVKPNKRNRKRKHCTRWVKVGSFTHTDTAGANRFRFMGRVKRHRLKPGKYRLRAVPTAPSGKGKAVVKRFRIKR